MLFILVAYLFIFSEYGIVKRIQVSSQLEDVKESIQESEAERDSMMLEIDMMESDVYTIERVAREEYGMIKPGEEIFVLDSTEIKKQMEEE